MLAMLKDRFPAWDFVGIEPDAALCEEAERNGVSVVHADGRRLPFGTGEFDVVLMCATLKHVQGYQTLLSECRRVSVGEARLLVLEPTPLGVYIGVLMGHFDRRYLPNVWSLRQSRKRLAAEGFRVIRTTRYILCPYPIMGVEKLEKALGATHLPHGIWQQALLAEKVTRT
jgi:SAM-dependent methyltransferase